MRYYDWNKIRKKISENIPKGLELATAGMRMDWFWTACTVWSKEEGYSCDIDKPECDEDRKLAGIRGSVWDSPILELQFKDGTTLIEPVYLVGERKRGNNCNYNK